MLVEYIMSLSEAQSSSTVAVPRWNNVEAKAQPYFTPFWMMNGSDVRPSNTTVPCMLSGKDLTILSNTVGQPIFSRTYRDQFC